MLTGMPIIASYVGGTPTLIDHKVNGMLYQEGDAYSLAGLILDLSNNFDIADKMAKNAKSTAMKRHSRKYIVERTISIYNSIVEFKEE
jgi:glycosyltransferase involved in cell wall biosynthesis